MRLIYYPPAFLLSRLFSYNLKRKMRKMNDNQVSFEGMERILYHIRKQWFSPKRNGSLDLNKQLIAAYFVTPGEMVIDVGAHMGTFSAYYSSLVGEKGQVFSYEAHPAIFSVLKAKMASYINVDCQHAAVSSTSNASIEIKIYPHDLSQQCATVEARLMNEERMPGDTTIVSVITKKLDDHVEYKPETRCCFIKIDVEGHEYAVIEGAKKILAQDRPILLYEYGFLPGHFETKTIGLLEQMGYFSYDCKTLKRVNQGYVIANTDLVAIPKERQKEFEALASFLG